MRHLLLCVLFLLSLSCGTVIAGELRAFELHDGSVLTGEILSLRAGVYTLKSRHHGTFTLEAAKVRAIRLHPPSEAIPAPEQSKSPAVEAQIQHLQQRLMGDAAIMQRITALQADPEIQAVLADATILQALQSNDFQTLLAHPKVQQLLNHPAIREISKQIKPE